MKTRHPLTGKCGEVNRECFKQPLVELWTEGSRVGGIRVQVGQLYPAGSPWEIVSGLRVHFPHRVIREYIVTTAWPQNRTPLQHSTVGSQVDNVQTFCTDDFYR